MPARASSPMGDVRVAVGADQPTYEGPTGIVGVVTDTAELQADAALWRQSVDEVAQDDADIAAYVQQLEEATDARELPDASGEAIAREFERYLRGRRRS